MSWHLKTSSSQKLECGTQDALPEDTPTRQKIVTEIGGYERLLDIITNPSHNEYREMMYWLGGRFDPAKFSVEKVNRRLKAVHLP